MAIGGYSVVSHWCLLMVYLLMVINDYCIVVIVGYYMLYYNYW